MKVTGNTLIAFNKWYSESSSPCGWFYDKDGEIVLCPSISMFYQSPDSHKYGVFVDFFDQTNLKYDTDELMVSFIKMKGPCKGNRKLARIEAVSTQNEYFNKK